MRSDPINTPVEHSLQVTPERPTDLRVASEHLHITADAVYNALGILVEKGVLRRIQPLGSPDLHGARVSDNHHHLICRGCGRVVDTDCAVGSAPCLTVVDDMGCRIDEAEVIYWGRCPNCLTQTASTD